MKKVPHCKDCDKCKRIDLIYPSYYCTHESFEEDNKQISVDNYPKTSPGWCPLRNSDKKVGLYIRVGKKEQLL